MSNHFSPIAMLKISTAAVAHRPTFDTVDHLIINLEQHANLCEDMVLDARQCCADYEDAAITELLKTHAGDTMYALDYCSEADAAQDLCFLQAVAERWLMDNFGF